MGSSLSVRAFMSVCSEVSSVSILPVYCLINSSVIYHRQFTEKAKGATRAKGFVLAKLCMCVLYLQGSQNVLSNIDTNTLTRLHQYGS